MEFRSVPLFGGAIQVDLPSSFADVSTIRQVPDHQEVHLSTTGHTSIIIEVLERVSAPSDAEALTAHLADIAAPETDELKRWTGGTAHLSKHPSLPCYTLLASTHVDVDAESRKPAGRRAKEEFTALLLVLVRLEGVGTDLLVVVNVPHFAGEFSWGEGGIELEKGRWGGKVDEGLEIRSRVLETLEIRDWSLFGEGEQTVEG